MRPAVRLYQPHSVLANRACQVPPCRRPFEEPCALLGRLDPEESVWPRRSPRMFGSRREESHRRTRDLPACGAFRGHTHRNDWAASVVCRFGVLIWLPRVASRKHSCDGVCLGGDRPSTFSAKAGSHISSGNRMASMMNRMAIARSRVTFAAEHAVSRAAVGSSAGRHDPLLMLRC